MNIYEELIERGLIAQVTNEKAIRDLLNKGQGKFYIGFDPTADSLHVGHFMTLALMKRLQDAGNTPIVLLGGGTAHIGDPSGRTDMRKMLAKKEIDANVEAFKKQIAHFIDLKKAIVLDNSEWLLKLNYVDLIRDVGPCFMVNNMLRAECYKLRMEKGLSFLEFNYMIMQAYDFYHLFTHYGCNLEFGGDDQWSNMLAGTELIRKKTGKDAHALTVNLLLTSDGKKMGKTESGAVWLDAKKTSPYDFYQYWRNINDNDVIKCFKMLTYVPLEEIHRYENYEKSRINELKEILAFELTKIVHNETEAKKAREMAKSAFSGNADNIPTKQISVTKDTPVLEVLLLANLVPSKSEGRRLIEQGGLLINDNKVNDINLIISLNDLKKGIKVKKGKKTFLKVICQ
ncbi:MAG: tyrosine--tRNA ligase [Bacilli bacterium]|nr:tyrosine--tRNA ligase [Bacilli bacterium]